MLTRNSQTQAAGSARAATRPQRARVRINGVSAPGNIRIGLVTRPAAAASSARLAPAAISAPPASGAPAAPARSAAAALPAAALRVALSLLLALLAVLWRTSLRSGAALRDRFRRTGSLARLSLAAAVLTVAMVLLLRAQFSGLPPEPAAAGASLYAGQGAPLAGAAAAATPDETPVRPIAGKTQGAAPTGGDALVDKITAGTLAALRSRPPQPATAPQAPGLAAAGGSALFRMVRTAAAQGQSEAYIHQLVNAAYRRQEISVPASLIRADGQVDTATILALLVSS